VVKIISDADTKKKTENNPDFLCIIPP